MLSDEEIEKAKKGNKVQPQRASSRAQRLHSYGLRMAGCAKQYEDSNYQNLFFKALAREVGWSVRIN